MSRSGVEIKQIRETYANMHDQEILAFAEQEGMKLSADAFIALKNELKTRNIGSEILQKLEYEIILQASIDKKRFTEDLNRVRYYETIEKAFTEKEKGKSNYDIYVGLIETGVSHEHANYIVNKLGDWAEELRKDSIQEIRGGIGIIILGVIVLYVTIEIGRFEAGASILVILGVTRTLIFLFKKSRYQRLIEKIGKEDQLS